MPSCKRPVLDIKAGVPCSPSLAASAILASMGALQVPRLAGTIGSAPDLLGDIGRIGVQFRQRVFETVDRNVFDLRQLAIELAAITAIGIGNDIYRALAVALYGLDGILQRQIAYINRWLAETVQQIGEIQ